MSTSRPFAYNSGSQVSGTDQLGQIAIGLTSSFNSGLGGLEWYNGPDEDLGYVICKTSSQRTWGNNAGNTSNTTIGFWRSPSKTENSFTSMVNSIFSQTFSTGDLAKTYLNNSGYWTSFSSFDPDAQLFITAANLTNSTQQNAINDLTLDMKAAGIWTKMTAIYPVVGGSSQSHKFNLKDPRDDNSAYRLNFVGTWNHTSTGMTPTNAYAETFLVPKTSLTLRNTHLSLYSRTNTSAGNKADFGCANITTANPSMFLSPKYLGSSVATSDAYQNTTNRIQVSNTDSTGFYISSRTSNVSHKLYKNNTILGTDTNTEVNSDMPNVQLTLGGFNFGGSVVQNSDRQYAFSTIGQGLTDIESQVFYQIIEKYQNALGRNVVATQSFYFNRNYSNETNAFIFNAGLTSSTQQSLVNTLVSDLTTAGVWSKMVAIYPMVGGTTQSHKFNLKNPIDSNEAYRLTFSSGWTHSSTGVFPNGAAYAETYIAPTSLTLSNTHLSYYSRTNIFESTNFEIGSYNGSGGNLFGLVFGRSPSNASSLQYDQFTSTNIALSTTQTDSRGFWMGNRTSNVGNTHKLWRNGNIIGTASTTGGSFLANTIWIGAINNSLGGPPFGYYTKKECAFSSVGSGLTDAEAQSYYTAVQNFQTGLGRNV